MAHELANSVVLMGDSTFRDWVSAAASHTATNVLASGSSTVAAKAMAAEVLVTPCGAVVERLVSMLATRFAICSVGDSVGEDEGQVGQALLLTEMGSIWSPLAAVLYPAA